MRKFEFNISDRSMRILALAILALTISSLVYAYTQGFGESGQPAAGSPSRPPVMGHSADEINVYCGTQLKTLQQCFYDLGNLGPKFISPVTVYSAPSLCVESSWTTFDASSYVPSGVTAVILEAEASMTFPDFGAGDIDTHIKIRKDSSSSEYVLLRGRSAADYDAVAWSSQGIFPVDSNRNFQFKIEEPGFGGLNCECSIRLIGYY